MAFYPLEDFYRKASQAQSIKPQMTNANFDQFNRSAFKQSIPYIDEMDDHNLTILIKNNIDVISSDILHDDPVYAQILTNQKFISAFIVVNIYNSQPTLRRCKVHYPESKQNRDPSSFVS